MRMRGHLLVLPGPELSADFFAGVQHAIHPLDRKLDDDQTPSTPGLAAAYLVVLRKFIGSRREILD